MQVHTASVRHSPGQRGQAPAPGVEHGGLALGEELIRGVDAQGARAWPKHAVRGEVGDGLECLDPLGSVVFDLASQRPLSEFHRLVVHQHGLNPRHQQRVPRALSRRVHHWHGAYCSQRLDHGLHVGQRPGWLESGLVEQRLVVEEGGHEDRAGVQQGQSEWMFGIVRLGSQERRINSAERRRQLRVRRKIVQQVVAHPGSDVQAIDVQQVDLLARRNGRASHAIPLDVAWQSPHVDRHVRVPGHELSHDLLARSRLWRIDVAGVQEDELRGRGLRHRGCSRGLQRCRLRATRRAPHRQTAMRSAASVRVGSTPTANRACHALTIRGTVLYRPY